MPGRRADRREGRDAPLAKTRPTRPWKGAKPAPAERRAAKPRLERGGGGAARGGKQRRALSMARAPGATGWGGEPELGRALVEALLDAGRDDVVADSLTHPAHTYPARLHPATARRLVEIVMDGTAADAVLLDPFCGSGTVLVEARAAGVRSIGVDLNPLAVLLARVKTWTVPLTRRRAARDLAHRIAGDVLAMGKEARRAGASPQQVRAPAGFDPNARQRRIGPWFSPHVRRELEALAGAIDEVRADDAEVGDLFTAALSAILYKVSHRQSDTDPTWVERSIARGAAARLFVDRVDLILAGLDDMGRQRGPMPAVLEADARALATLELPPIAGIVTSPPYAGTYDYAAHHRLRFDFLGIRHRALDEGELGARRHFADDRDGAAARWQDDLAAAVGAMASVMVPGALAALVVGDSLAGGRARHADDDLRSVLDDRLAVVAWAWQERPALGAERRVFTERPKREHVVVLARR
ncbi:MAG TPA: DNA methyltransferase [Kofleriaceae bacterium]|nr:DNA methyltransferase [Kofleriaceae bacterium]